MAITVPAIPSTPRAHTHTSSVPPVPCMRVTLYPKVLMVVVAAMITFSWPPLDMVMADVNLVV